MHEKLSNDLPFRWFEQLNCNVPLQAKPRELAKEWTKGDVVCQKTPFRFPVPDKRGHFQVLEAPWAYIKDFRM